MKRTYVVMVILIVIFAAPGVVAYLFYTHPGWLKGTTNRGTIVQSPQTIMALSQTNKWQLIYWSPMDCGADCAKKLDDLARVRLALGRHLYQIDTVLLLGQVALSPSDGLQHQLSAEDIKMLRVACDHDQQVLGRKSAIFIANPQHAVIMVYGALQPADDMYQDLKRLVKDK